MTGYEYASAYAAIGWHVFPTRPAGQQYTDRRGKPQTANGKEPLTANGFQDATASPDAIQRHFSDPGMGVGFWPGASGVLVLDVDVKGGKQGPAQLQAIQDRAGKELPQTLTQNSPSGGFHLFFTLPEGWPAIGNSHIQGAPDVDVRSANGYICLEGTQTTDGGYSFNDWDPLTDPAPEIAPAPVWLLEMLAKPAEKPVEPPRLVEEAYTRPDEVARIMATLPHGLRELIQRGAREGERSDQFHHAVGWCKDRGLSEEQTAAVIEAYPFGIADKYVGRVAEEVARCWSKVQDKTQERQDATQRDPNWVNPLTRFVTLGQKPKAVKWAIAGMIQEGVMTIAGARGVGKTTAVIPLSMIAAGLHAPGNPLAPHPERWRHVIYIVEMVEQAENILRGVVEHAGLGITWEQVQERFHLVPARRVDAALIADAGKTYREMFTRTVQGVEIAPLCVFDTQAAIFEMQNENDNAEASRIMATMKQTFEDLPAWIVCHIAKMDIGRDDATSLTARGAGAFEADADGNFYIVQDQKTKERFFLFGKHRAKPRHGTEYRIQADEATMQVENEWGEIEDLHLTWALTEPMQQSRAEVVAAGRALADQLIEQQEREQIRGRLFETARDAWEKGDPLSPSNLRERVTGVSKTKRDQYLVELMNEGRLIQRDVPRNLLKHPTRKAYILPMEPDEYLTYTQTGELPPKKAKHPPTWAKDPAEEQPATRHKEGGEDAQN